MRDGSNIGASFHGYNQERIIPASGAAGTGPAARARLAWGEVPAELGRRGSAARASGRRLNTIP
jgi:hypothetical protein